MRSNRRYERAAFTLIELVIVIVIMGVLATLAILSLGGTMDRYQLNRASEVIELFDAHSGEFLADYGPVETPELAFLPLEDAQRDAPIEPEVVVVHEHGGGASDLWFLLALCLCAVPAARPTRLTR